MFAFARQFVAQHRCLAQNIDFGCAFLVFYRRNRAFELFEQIFEPYPTLAFHVVVQVALLQRLKFVGIGKVALIWCLLFLATAAAAVAAACVVVVVAALLFAVTAANSVAVGAFLG